jgi:hypothetical protein
MRWQKLVSTFGIAEAEAKELILLMRRAVDPGEVQPSAYPYEDAPLTTDDVMERANEILGGFGVESIDCGQCNVDSYYFGIVLLYVNKGDTYSTTLLYDTEAQKFRIGSWGSWFEDHEVRSHFHEGDEGEEEFLPRPRPGEHSKKNWRPS